MSDQLTLQALGDTEIVAGLLVDNGLSESTVQRKTEMFAAAAASLIAKGNMPDSPARAFFVPGRIEVLGKHTDYCGGRSVLATAERGFCMIAVDRSDSDVRVMANSLDEQAEFKIDPSLVPGPSWTNYPMTVARRLARNFSGTLCGADIAFDSDLPVAAGMSSSSALMVAHYLAFAAINSFDQREELIANIDSLESLAGYLGTVENGQSFGTLEGDKGVGTFGGSEDHTAVLCCTSGRMSQYSYRPSKFEKFLDLPSEHVFVVCSSGVVAEKTGDAMYKYNYASQLARTAVDAWNQATGRNDAHLAAAVASSANAVEEIRRALKDYRGSEFTPADLLRRFEHFYAESEEIIPAAGEALATGDIDQFGRLVDRSQELTDTLLQNQVPETIFLARSARDVGAAAASAFGAGFGGSVWALMKADQAQSQMEAWTNAYHEAYPQQAARSEHFITRPGPAAFAL